MGATGPQYRIGGIMGGPQYHFLQSFLHSLSQSQFMNNSSQMLCPSAMSLLSFPASAMSLLGSPAVPSLGSSVVDSTASYHHSRSHLQSCSFNNWSHLSHLSLSSSGVSMISLGSLVLSSLGSSLLSPVADSQPKVGNTTAYGTSALQSSWPNLGVPSGPASFVVPQNTVVT